MSAPTTPRVIKAGRVVETDDGLQDDTTELSPKASKSAATKARPAAKTAKPAGGKPAASAKRTTTKNAAKSGAKADKADRPSTRRRDIEDSSDSISAKRALRAARVAQADDELAAQENDGLDTRIKLLLGAVAAVIVFQIVHSAEHVAQATYWLFNPTVAPWMSAWAMGLANGLASAVGGSQALGMELLHLVGNVVFFAGLLVATRLPAPWRNATSERWLRLAIIVEGLHLIEHVFLTLSVAVGGRAIGVSTMFGLLSTGTPAAAGYRVFFHLVVNIVALVFLIKAVLAVRDGRQAAQGRTPTGFDWTRLALVASPALGLLLLLPFFGGHVNAAAASDDVVVAIVNGEEISNAQLQAQVEALRGQTNVPVLGQVSPDTDVVTQTGQQFNSAQVQASALNSLVQSTLVRQGAEALGVSITDADIQARRDQLISETFLTEAAYDKWLTDNNVTAEYEIEQLRGLITEERVQQFLVRDYVIGADSVQTVFESQYANWPRARHLLTTSEPLAEQYLAQVEAGADFETLIRENSIDPRAASTGGYMGTVRENMQVPELTAAIADMADGEYRVIRTQFGFHVIQRLPEPTLADVEAEIRSNLLLTQMGTAGQEWIQEIRLGADVTLTEGFGVWDTEFGAVVPAEEGTASPAAGVHSGGQHG